MNNIIHLIGQDNTMSISLPIAEIIGIEKAAFISRFFFLQERLSKKNIMDKEGKFFIIPKKFTKPIGMSLHSFRKIVKEYETMGLLITQSKGLPLKKWYLPVMNKWDNYLGEILKEYETNSKPSLQVVESNNL